MRLIWETPTNTCFMWTCICIMCYVLRNCKFRLCEVTVYVTLYVQRTYFLITEVIRSLCEHVICFKVYVHVHEIMHSFTSIASFACLLLHQRWTSCFKGFRNIKRSLDFRMALNAHFKKRKCFSKEKWKVNDLVMCLPKELIDLHKAGMYRHETL